VKLLLDAHVVLWWLQDDRRLKAEARRAIATAAIVWISAATAMEIAVKASRRRLRLPESLAVTVATDDFTELPLTIQHTEQLARLPAHHGDLFDRILVAQAVSEGATIVTHDRALGAYDVPVIWT
jgi:PIN domain nuclease of toxin-antitoxin system